MHTQHAYNPQHTTHIQHTYNIQHTKHTTTQASTKHIPGTYTTQSTHATHTTQALTKHNTHDTYNPYQHTTHTTDKTHTLYDKPKHAQHPQPIQHPKQPQHIQHAQQQQEFARTHKDPQKVRERRTTTGDSSNDSPKRGGSTKLPIARWACNGTPWLMRWLTRWLRTTSTAKCRSKFSRGTHTCTAAQQGRQKELTLKSADGMPWFRTTSTGNVFPYFPVARTRHTTHVHQGQKNAST